MQAVSTSEAGHCNVVRTPVGTRLDIYALLHTVDTSVVAIYGLSTKCHWSTFNSHGGAISIPTSTDSVEIKLGPGPGPECTARTTVLAVLLNRVRGLPGCQYLDYLRTSLTPHKRAETHKHSRRKSREGTQNS